MQYLPKITKFKQLYQITSKANPTQIDLLNKNISWLSPHIS